MCEKQQTTNQSWQLKISSLVICTYTFKMLLFTFSIMDVLIRSHRVLKWYHGCNRYGWWKILCLDCPRGGPDFCMPFVDQILSQTNLKSKFYNWLNSYVDSPFGVCGKINEDSPWCLRDTYLKFSILKFGYTSESCDEINFLIWIFFGMPVWFIG